MSTLSLDDFDYVLPEALIAQQPAATRSHSRMLVLPRDGTALADTSVCDLPALLAPGDLLVANDTRVVCARLHGLKPTGGRVELLLERVLDERRALAQVRSNRALRAGTVFRLCKPGSDATPGPEIRVIGRQHDLYELEAIAWDELMADYGQLPLPPYIQRQPDEADAERYQTVFASEPGAVAAPTAGLHFDPPLLEALAAAGIAYATLTLHVGAGTFQPVRGDIASHRMHSERYVLPPSLAQRIERTRSAGGRVVAVGTTVVRALESAALASAGSGLQAGSGDTELFIKPGFRFRVVDALMTNFHLPRTTLMMLVSALCGRERLLAAYAHAVRERYRFFSYGDAMLIL